MAMVNSNSLFSLNGQPVADNLPLSLLSDRGLAYGHGLFESILLNQSQLRLVDRHLSRFADGANALDIPIESTVILQYVNSFVDQLKAESVSEGVVKVMVTAGIGGRGYKSPKTVEPTVICSYSNLPEDISYYRTQPLSVRFCQHRLSANQPLAGIKHLNRLDQIVARNEWRCENYDEGLMFNQSNCLVEAISANVFIKNNSGQWITPCLKEVGVAGVMRSVMIEEIFPACEIPVSISQISRDELIQSQVLLTCNSIRGLASVGSMYNHQNQWVKSLPIDQQTLMLRKKLIELYPQYQ